MVVDPKPPPLSPYPSGSKMPWAWCLPPPGRQAQCLGLHRPLVNFAGQMSHFFMAPPKPM